MYISVKMIEKAFRVNLEKPMELEAYVLQPRRTKLRMTKLLNSIQND
jgi:hypothetical protein